MKIKEIGFVVYAVTDMPKARAFYEGVLGLSPNSEYNGSGNPMWVEYNIGPGTLAIGCDDAWKPSEDGVVAALEVEDFDQAITELKEKKVYFKLEPQDYPSCKMAVVIDPDKNKILIHQRKTK